MPLLLATMHPGQYLLSAKSLCVSGCHVGPSPTDGPQIPTFSCHGHFHLFALLIYLGSQRLPCKDSDGFPFLHGLPFIGSWDFTRRHFFAHEGLVKLGDVFSFNVLQVRLPYLSMAHLPLM